MEGFIKVFPSSLMIELTNICQLSCITCPREYSVVKKYVTFGNMDFCKFKDLVDRYISYLRTLSLTGGGETFLYPYLVEAVNYVIERNRDIEIFISTNAVAPQTEVITRELAGKVRTIQISIDGTDRVYEKIRKKANFSRFIGNAEAITSICGSNTSVIFNMVLIKENLYEILPVLRLARDIGVRVVNVTPINLVIHDWDMSYYEFFDSEAVKDSIVEAQEFAEREGISFHYYDISQPPGFKKCPFLKDNFYITWDGFLVPCCAKPIPRLLNFGNVFERGLMDCINHPLFIEFRGISQVAKSHPFCYKCHLIERQ